MLIIGLLIVVAAAAFAGVVVSENWGGGTYAVKGFGHVLGHYTLAQIFLSAVVLTAIFFFGLWAASVSTRLRRRASSRRRADARAAREEHDELVAERDRLARDLAAQRAAAGQPVAAPEQPVQLPPSATPPVVLDDGPLMREVEV
jgi:signal transduction histidine kinase